MPTHRCLTRVERSGGGTWEPDELVDYGGEPDFKFEPLDPIARETWARDVAEPNRVLSMRRANGCVEAIPESFLPHMPPPLPVSGWQGG